MIRGNDVNASFMPNRSDAAVVGKEALDDHLVSVRWIEGKVGINVPATDALKSNRPRESWKNPAWCKVKLARFGRQLKIRAAGGWPLFPEILHPPP